MGWFRSGLKDYEIDVDSLADLLQKGQSPFIVDVREPFEVEERAFPGALNIPLGLLDARMSEIPTDKPVAVLCRSGARSDRAVSILRQKGYTNVKNILGGMMAWSHLQK